MDRAASRIAFVAGSIAAVGVASLVIASVLRYATPLRSGLVFGTFNDVCVLIQYLLSIPLALSLQRILGPQAPTLMRGATVIGIASMLAVAALQAALLLRVLKFEQQVVPVTLTMIVGVGTWLAITGLVARSVTGFPNSLRMSLIAVPYLGYPFWAFWLARRLRGT